MEKQGDLSHPRINEEKNSEKNNFGEDIFHHSWVVSKERSEAGVQSRRTQG